MLSFFPPAPLRSSCFRELSHLIWLCGRFSCVFRRCCCLHLLRFIFICLFLRREWSLKIRAKWQQPTKVYVACFFCLVLFAGIWSTRMVNMHTMNFEYKKNENNEVCRKSHCFGIEIAKAMSVENGWTTDRCYDFRWEYRTKVSWWNFMEIYQTQPTLFRAIQFHHFNHIHQTIRMIAFFFAYNVPPSF